jgi:hypothetical protein
MKNSARRALTAPPLFAGIFGPDFRLQRKQRNIKKAARAAFTMVEFAFSATCKLLRLTWGIIKRGG